MMLSNAIAHIAIFQYAMKTKAFLHVKVYEVNALKLLKTFLFFFIKKKCQLDTYTKLENKTKNKTKKHTRVNVFFYMMIGMHIKNWIKFVLFVEMLFACINCYVCNTYCHKLIRFVC